MIKKSLLTMTIAVLFFGVAAMADGPVGEKAAARSSCSSKTVAASHCSGSQKTAHAVKAEHAVNTAKSSCTGVKTASDTATSSCSSAKLASNTEKASCSSAKVAANTAKASCGGAKLASNTAKTSCSGAKVAADAKCCHEKAKVADTDTKVTASKGSGS